METLPLRKWYKVMQKNQTQRGSRHMKPNLFYSNFVGSLFLKDPIFKVIYGLHLIKARTYYSTINMYMISGLKTMGLYKICSENGCAEVKHFKQKQAFRFMVGPGHCPMVSKYGP